MKTAGIREDGGPMGRVHPRCVHNRQRTHRAGFAF
jgi:hypothetical protein